MVDGLHNKVNHIHICDGFISGGPDKKDKIFDEHLMPGEGNQPIAETLNYLLERNWDGNIVAEVNTRKVGTANNRLTMLTKTRGYVQEILTTFYENK